MKTSILFASLLLTSLTHAESLQIQGFEIPGPSPLRQNIVLNGAAVRENSRLQNFTVALDITNGTGYGGGCTGVIISQDLILTAGHCVPIDGLTVKVKFGRGGASGYTTELISTEYRSFDSRPPQAQNPAVPEPSTPSPTPPPPPAPPNPWVNGVLTFDLAMQRQVRAALEERADFVNYFHYAAGRAQYIRSFRDLALIKISGLPTGYSPIAFYNGNLDFKQTVYAVGYGINSRVRSEIQIALRAAEQKVVGHFTVLPDNVHLGLQYYSPAGHNICFGDSGGPVVVDDNGVYKLIGLNTFVMNNCADVAWSTSVGSPIYRSFILRWAEELRGTISL